MVESDISGKELSEVEINGRLALFTEQRVKRETLPEGIFCYDLRHGDDMGAPVSIENRVVVNHFGTILTAIPFDFGDSDYLSVDYEKFWFTGERMTLEQYREKMWRALSTWGFTMCRSAGLTLKKRK